MKSTRAHFILSVTVCAALCAALLMALAGYFRSMERGGVLAGSEKRLLSQLKIFQEQLRATDAPEQAKAAVKMLESATGLGVESEGARELKKAYAPMLAAFAAKPREAEARFQLAKKRELMEGLVNAYRKEIPHGEIRVRAAYLNILFDTQASLLGESDEAELAYIRRNRERLEALRSPAGSADPSLAARVGALESLLQSYERGFQQAVKWRAEKSDALARLEKGFPALARSIHGSEDSYMDEAQRGFLYTCFLSFLIAGAGFLALYLGFRILQVRSVLRRDAFLTYLRGFGSEGHDPQLASALKALREDGDWSVVLAEAQQSEEAFLRSCQDQLAVPRSLRAPFVVIGKDRSLRHWNESAAALFNLSGERDWGLDDLLDPGLLSARDGATEALLEAVRSSFAGVAEDRFELLLRQGGDWVPYELSLNPVSNGPLGGGRVMLWREIRSETARIDRSVASQLQKARDALREAALGLGGAAPEAAEGDVPALRQMLDELSSFRRRNSERELLWKSEVQALIDQVSRQQDILHRLSTELVNMRAGQAEALDLVRHVHGGDEHMHDEVCGVERDLQRWSAGRRRLAGDIRQMAAALERARQFEERLRQAASEAAAELASYREDVGGLRRFAESARLHGVNLSLAGDPGSREYASRARAFAQELARFADKAEELGGKMTSFLSSHPGSALAALLAGPGLDETALDAISEEQERLSAHLRRWKENGELILSGGERAVALLQDGEKTGAVASQLGETTLLISQQARGNLERWN